MQTGSLANAATADAVVAPLKSGMNVFVNRAAATPTTLLEALPRRTDLEGVRLWHLLLEGPMPLVTPEHAGRFHSVSLFTGGSLRGPVNEGRADFVPIFLSDLPALFTSGRVRLDAVTVFCLTDRPLPTLPACAISPVAAAIGGHVASLVEAGVITTATRRSIPAGS